jgi:hypothetical protein
MSDMNVIRGCQMKKAEKKPGYTKTSIFPSRYKVRKVRDALNQIIYDPDILGVQNIGDWCLFFPPQKVLEHLIRKRYSKNF